MHWVVTPQDLEKYKHERLDRSSADAIRQYYSGLKLASPRKQMYDDEIKDLEAIYRKSLSSNAKKITNIMPSLLYEMKEFIKLQEEQDMVQEKLDNLLAKKESHE